MYAYYYNTGLSSKVSTSETEENGVHYETLPLSNVVNSVEYAIKIRLVIKDLLSIDVTNKKFRCTYIMCVQYKMIPLDCGQNNHNYIEYDGDRYNRISFILTNCLEAFDDGKEKVIHVSDDSKDGYYLRCEISWINTADFRFSSLEGVSDYPLDSHRLVITVLISPFNYEASKYYFADFPDANISFPNGLSNIESVCDEWDVYRASLVQYKQKNRLLLQVGFRIQRKVDGFLWNGFFIILILALMCFSIFSLEFSEMASRLNVLTTILLTMVALKTVLQANAPVTPRANYLDVYLNSGIFLNVSLTLAVCLGSSLGVSDPDLFETMTLVAFAGAWGLYSVFFVLHLQRKVWEHKRLYEAPLVPHRAADVAWHGDVSSRSART